MIDTIPISVWPGNSYSHKVHCVHLLLCKGNNHVPPNRRIGYQNLFPDSPPSLTMNPWGWIWKTPPQQCPQLQQLSSYLTLTQQCYEHQGKSIVCFICILGIILPPHICYLSISPRSFSLPWGFSQLSKSLIFRGYQWPNHWFSTCSNQPRGSSNMFRTHGVMVN